MAKAWVMVRIEQSVYEELVEMRDSLARAYAKGQVSLPDDADGMSLSTFVGRLVRHVRNDRRRMREAAARRRARRRLERFAMFDDEHVYMLAHGEANGKEGDLVPVQQERGV